MQRWNADDHAEGQPIAQQLRHFLDRDGGGAMEKAPHRVTAMKTSSRSGSTWWAPSVRPAWRSARRISYDRLVDRGLDQGAQTRAELRHRGHAVEPAQDGAPPRPGSSSSISTTE